MVAINMLAFNYVGNESTSIKMQCFPVVDLLATFLNAFLLPLYTMKESQNISEYYTLPAGNKKKKLLNSFNEKTFFKTINITCCYFNLN